MRRFVCLILIVGALSAPAASAYAQPEAAAQRSGPVLNLNTATVEQLEELPGIGRRTAERILEHRQKSGGFKKIEELMNVRGIGEKSFLRLKPMITVTAKPEKPGEHELAQA